MIGLRILKRRRAVDLALARQFLDVPVANVSEWLADKVADSGRGISRIGAGFSAATENAVKAEIATGQRRQAWLDKVLSAHGLL